MNSSCDAGVRGTRIIRVIRVRIFSFNCGSRRKVSARGRLNREISSPKITGDYFRGRFQVLRIFRGELSIRDGRHAVADRHIDLHIREVGGIKTPE